MSDTDNLFIPNQEIKPGNYVANTITSKHNTFVRLLNTTSTDQLISLTNLKCEPISDHNVIQNTSSSREQNIIEELKKKISVQFEQQLTELCGKYTDVFSLETESITTNNFYKQKLRLKDNEPIFIKNKEERYSRVPRLSDTRYSAKETKRK